jgi:type I restriction enzyme, S subunit
LELRRGYKKMEAGVIPEDWNAAPVGRMGEVVTGKALAVSAPGQQRPYLRTKNVFDGRIDIQDVLSMPMTDAQFSQFALKYGDVLLNEGQSLELVGRCAVYRDEYSERCAIQNQLLRFRARPGVCGDFASHLFRFCQQIGVFARVALQTTSIAHLGSKRFENLVLAWPPTDDEQRAIATTLSDMDALLGGLDQLIAKKRDLKQAVMQQLLTGQTRLSGFHGEWEVKRLGELAEIVSGGTPRTTEPSYWNGDFKWCTPTDITSCRGKYLHATERTISELGLYNSGARLLPAGALLLCSRATIGEVRIASGEICTNQGFKSLVCTEEVSNEFLYYKLLTLKQKMLERAFGSTFLEISKGNLAAIEVNTPRLLEQTAIAAVLSDMDAELSTLEARRDKTRDLKQAMMQELLTGKTRLVPTGGVHAA